jgi:hypothetical protein
MAVTKIKQIYTTERDALSYILTDLKTDNGELTEFGLCRNSAAKAAKDFADIRGQGSGRSKILAEHIIQSFAPGEVTRDEAFEIGKQLTARLLHGEYQYVLATHIDKEHIHNHLIFNNISLANFKTFETNENRGKSS